MSPTRFHRNHAQHIDTSEKLRMELELNAYDMLKQISNLNQKLSHQLLIKVINRIVRGISAVIPDLEDIVIKNNLHEENSAALKDVVQNINQYCYDIVGVYDCDSNSLQQKLKKFIQNILHEGEALLDIIKRDDLHDFKHELVENLKEIMYTIQIGQVRMQVENYTQEELKHLVETLQKDYVKDVSIIDTCSLEVLRTMTIHVKYNAKHAFQMAYYLHKVASNYHDIEVQNKLSEAANILNRITTAILLIDDKFTDRKVAVEALTQWSNNGWKAVTGLFEFIDASLANKKHSENLKDVARSIISYAVVTTTHVGRSIKTDGLFA